MISIVLPTYNRQAYLSETIDSILAQTHKDWELVIVDDGSTDDSDVLIRYYLKKDKRIRYFRLAKNSGISFARNFGVSKAKGEYICVMDADDIMNPNRLKKSLRAIKNVDFVYSPYLPADEHAKVTHMIVPPEKVTFEDVKRNGAWPHVTIMARKQCFTDNPYRNDFRVNDDGWLVWKWFQAGYKNKMIQEPLVIQRGHSLNTSRSRRKEIEKTQEILDKEYEDAEQSIRNP